MKEEAAYSSGVPELIYDSNGCSNPEGYHLQSVFHGNTKT
jgi:hypothetical protein